MKLDMHLHSSYSSDGKVPPKDLLKLAKSRGFDGLAITDHNDIRAYAIVKDLAAEMGLILVRGIEVSTSEGHLLAYGVSEVIPRGLTPSETAEKIVDAGGICVIPHPYRLVSGIGEKASKKIQVTGMETINGRSPNGDNTQAERLAGALKLPCTGGSDAHVAEAVGKAWTEFKNPVSNEDDVIAAITSGQCSAGGCGMTSSETVKYTVKAFSKWVGRGFKKV